MSDQSTATDDKEGEESVDDTLDQLADTVENSVAEDEDDTEETSESGAESDTETDTDEPNADDDTRDVDVETPDADVETLIARAVEDIESLLAGFSGEESIEQATADIKDLIEVGEEAVELLGSLDPTALAGAVEPEELPDAIDLEDVPEAAAEADPGEAIKYRKLLQVIELTDVWNEMDVREVWENKREFGDELDDVTEGGSSSDEGPLAALRHALDVLTGDGEFFEDDADDAGTTNGGPGGPNGTNGDTAHGDHEDIDVPTEVAQQRIQSGLDDAIEEFREGLLDVREQLQAKKAENAERVEDLEQPTSRNPTAYSTLSTAGRSTREVAKHSTVPTETKYSNAPNRERLYGSRLDTAGGGDDE